MNGKRGELHHVEIYVSDLEISRQFWSFILEYLGYELYQQWKDGFSYRLGSTYLVFVQAEEDFLQPDYHRKRVGLNHLAFEGGTRQCVDEITALLRQRKIPILYEDRHPYAGGQDYYAVFFEDPDRIKVEIVASNPDSRRNEK